MNKRILLDKRPVGLPDKSTWRFDQQKITNPGDGEILVKQHYISLDPAMRGWVNDVKSYVAPVQVGELMRAGTVGEVVMSNNHPKFQVGDYVAGWGGVQLYHQSDGKGYHQVDPTIAPLPTFIGTLGMPGMTAYFGLLEVGELKDNDVVLISGAAGSVGSVAGQIAKIRGCRVIGIAGGPEKCEYLINDLGFDGAIDYKNESVRSGIKEHCPDGVDLYFDNVGGDILNEALARLRRHARVVICGAISQYNNREKVQGPSNYLSLLVNRATMRGMVVFDYAKSYGTAASELARWMTEGKLKSREDIYEGIENFHEIFLKLFSGDKLGKLVLKVS